MCVKRADKKGYEKAWSGAIAAAAAAPAAVLL
jgi:hypothetical protein